MRLLLGLSLLFSIIAHGGNEVQNGGDHCESNLIIIKEDIRLWIKTGGHNGLELPENISSKMYSSQMLNAIKNVKVSCSEKILTYMGTEKTCINTNKSEEQSIQCNLERFKSATIEEQYRLVHHELAGLAKLEMNLGHVESNYFISNQIAAYLEEETVSRLAIKQRSSNPLQGIYTASITPSASRFYSCSARVIETRSEGLMFQWMDLNDEFDSKSYYCRTHVDIWEFEKSGANKYIYEERLVELNYDDDISSRASRHWVKWTNRRIFVWRNSNGQGDYSYSGDRFDGYYSQINIELKDKDIVYGRFVLTKAGTSSFVLKRKVVIKRNGIVIAEFDHMYNKNLLYTK